MPRVHHVLKARKAQPENGIAVGDSYFWWEFKTGPRSSRRVVSKKAPRPSQLTMSDFKSQWRGFAEEMQDLALDDSLHDALQEIAGRIRDLGSEQEDKLGNMPDGLQQSPTGELLQERVDACSNWADEIEGLEQPELEEPETPDFEDRVEDATYYTAEVGTDFETAEDAYDAMYDAAHIAWEEYGTEVLDAIERAREEYDSALESLKEDAINADPGEV
jgi:hypothetical protein